MSTTNGATEQLIAAAIELLEDGGWPAVTSRGVAARADVNVGLIHYYFGGMPGLRRAVVNEALERVVGPMHGLGALATQPDALVRSAVDALMATTTAAPNGARVTGALIEGALREPDLADLVREALRAARRDLADQLHAVSPQLTRAQAAALAALLVAALDGLALHAMIDADLPHAAAVRQLCRVLPISEEV